MGFLSTSAAEVGVQVTGQGVGVGGCAVDVGGGTGTEHRQAQDVESRGAADHSAVVADAPRSGRGRGCRAVQRGQGTFAPGRCAQIGPVTDGANGYRKVRASGAA